MQRMWDGNERCCMNPSSRFQPIEFLVSQNRHLRGMSIPNCLRKRWAGGMWKGGPPRSARGIRTSCSNHACLVLQATADQRTWDEGKGGGGEESRLSDVHDDQRNRSAYVIGHVVQYGQLPSKGADWWAVDFVW